MSIFLNYLLVVIMTGIAAFASFFLKKASISRTLKDLIMNKWLWVGGIMYVISAILNIMLLQRMPYSVVVPIGAVCFIWTMIISSKFLHEKISYKKIIGLGCILIGIISISL